MSLSAEPNPFPAYNAVSVLDHVSDRLVQAGVPPIADEKEQTCMGACNPSDRMRDAAASDVEFFIVAIRVREACSATSTLLVKIVREVRRSVVVMLWVGKRRA